MMRLALAALMIAAPSVAEAQVTFQSPKAGSLAPGFVVMCLDSNGLAVPQSNGACPGQTITTSDPNNAAFSTPTPFTVGGAAIPVGRSTAAVCTAAGTVVYTMPGGTLSWPLVVGGQILPFAVTGASSGPACTYTNLN